MDREGLGGGHASLAPHQIRDCTGTIKVTSCGPGFARGWRKPHGTNLFDFFLFLFRFLVEFIELDELYTVSM